MYKVGIVFATDKTQGVRVTFPDCDDAPSNWLQVCLPFITVGTDCYLPKNGAQVACIMEDNMEEGCVIGHLLPDNSVDKTVIDNPAEVSGVKIENGVITCTDIIVNGKPVDGHKHGGVQAGGANTGAF